ncbi:uncharacterized protein EV420DRAFT_1265734 [Desarmillaria tabescens]|uniref:Uncharacterized protein n=1 Tax=Armillaria tabescens TaxID=1929756 RepID=A0AA39NB23_ARMTA|nr:uncharacterized protein EV420DRAFT_1265734 [Desarmillaria tabescens]KAK0462337.1 hypothetical protein EV420DRAFT_1265734 [Desarmillaria tabescens]
MRLTKYSGSTRTQSISSSGSSKQATSYGRGGGAVSTIPSGQLFAGRTQGGGTRDQVMGTSTYGSGYPGVASRGVAGLGFPFYYWPLAWGGIGLGSAAYLHNNEYGRPDNSSRPGGAMTYATFPATSGNATFHVVADNNTVASLITDLTSNCSSVINTSSVSSSPIAFNDSDSSTPKPEQSVQYYRASSVALTVDGYNNTGALQNDTADTPIPSWVDTNALNCLNSTIGVAVPLVDGAARQWVAPNVGLVALLFVFYHLSSFF